MDKQSFHDLNASILQNLMIRGHNPEKEDYVDLVDGKMAWTIAGFKTSLDNDQVPFII